jgi:hypothetical protein
MLNVIWKRFEEPDELRVFEKGKFEIVTLRRDDDWKGVL